MEKRSSGQYTPVSAMHKDHGTSQTRAFLYAANVRLLIL